MIMGVLLLLAGLTISAVAIYYSVIGLAAIFAGAVLPIYIMGGTLEVAKLIAATWLKANWHRPIGFIKYYMSIAVILLMVITSMGIFGFLSKAHLDQTIPTGDVQSQVFLIDEKIKIERENIANAQSLIKQLDAAVTGVIATGDQEFTRKDGTTGVRSAAERSLQIRRSQAKDRAALTKQIEEAQTRIVKLQEEKAPIASKLRAVEAEVGPIKYIAAFVYGENPDKNLLEKAVTWVIILLVIVFDPLAIAMLLAAQMTFGWYRKQNPEYEPDDGPLTEKQIEQIKKESHTEEKEDLFPTYEEITPKDEEPKPHHPDTHPYLREGFKYPENYEHVPPQVYTPPTVTEVVDNQPKPEFKVEAVVEYVPAEPPITVDRTDHTVDEAESKYQILPELDEELKKKSQYIIKDLNQQILKKKD